MRTHSLEAWEKLIKGNKFFVRYTKEGNTRARKLFKQATDLDPHYAFAWSLLAWTHIIDALFNFGNSQTDSLNKALKFTYKASSIDDTIPGPHSSFGFINLMQRNYEKGISEVNKALSLAPNDATNHMIAALIICYSGEFKQALSYAKKAMRLSPHIPSWYFAILGLTYYMAEQYEDSLSAYKQLLKQSQFGEIAPIWAHIGLASVYIQLNRKKEARVHAIALFNLDPTFSLNWVRNFMLFKNPSDLDLILNALRKAGVNRG